LAYLKYRDIFYELSGFARVGFSLIILPLILIIGVRAPFGLRIAKGGLKLGFIDYFAYCLIKAAS